MSNKKEKIIDNFLESHNMDFLFCILAEKESERLSLLPDSVKKSFKEKSTTMALKHIALNDVPDYIVEEYESKSRRPDDDDYDYDYDEEYEDDESYDDFNEDEEKDDFDNEDYDD